MMAAWHMMRNDATLHPQLTRTRGGSATTRRSAGDAPPLEPGIGYPLILGSATPLYWSYYPLILGSAGFLLQRRSAHPVFASCAVSTNGGFYEYTAKSWFTVPHTGLSAADIIGKLTQAKPAD